MEMPSSDTDSLPRQLTFEELLEELRTRFNFDIDVIDYPPDVGGDQDVNNPTSNQE